MDAARRATFQVLAWNPAAAPTTASGGSAVAVFRDTDGAGTGRLYVVTAAHCVPPEGSPLQLRLVDHALRRYDAVEVLVADVVLDVAVLRVAGVPLDVPPGAPGESHPAFPRTLRPYRAAREGEAVYCVGWPRLVDATSFSRGCVRSATGRSLYAASATNLLIDAPIEPGNSGGGVFRAATGELLGVVSYRLENQSVPWSIAGVVPMRVLQQAMATVMYEGRAPRWPIAYNAPHLGLGVAEMVDPASYRMLMTAAGAGFTSIHPALQSRLAALGRGGMYVAAQHASSPAAVSAGVPVSAAADGSGTVWRSVLWAVQRADEPGAEPVIVCEERPLDEILESFADIPPIPPRDRAGVLSRRRAPPAVSQYPALPGAPTSAEQNPARPAQAVQVRLYLSNCRIVASNLALFANTHHSFRVNTVTLPFRATVLAQNVNPNPAITVPVTEGAAASGEQAAP